MLANPQRIPLPGSHPTVRLAEILLDPSAPAGEFRGTVSVALPDGQHVDIPASAVVAAPKPAADKAK
jgi:hypothetical protein